MPQLQYVGSSHFRDLTKKDLVDAGVPADTEGLGALHFAREDKDKSWNPKRVPHTLEVPQAVVDLLTDLEPDDWKVVNDEADFADPAAGVDDPSAPENTPNVADNPAVDVAGTDTTSTVTATGGSSTTPASRGGRR